MSVIPTLVEMIVETAQEKGPWDFSIVIGLLQANHCTPEMMSHSLKTLRGFVH